ncbi:MAG: hypothetical protein IJT91_06540 [Clostridia bacterium]|nr:hypothetical protein [Clostridia bacterium]
MELSDEKLRECSRRILLSRLRILTTHGFYGVLLMHMKIGLGDECRHAYTDGRDHIYLNPGFLDSINDRELDYVLMHEIMHVVLQHGSRLAGLEPERANIAADIVVDSNLLRSFDGDESRITLQGSVKNHKAPDGREGYEFSVEELYKLIPDPNGKPLKGPGSKKPGGGSGSGNKGENGEEDDSSEDGGDGYRARGRGKHEQAKFLPRSKNDPGWDEHLDTRGEETEEDDEMRDVWVKRIADACEAISIRDPSNSRGLVPAFAERLYGEYKKPQTDWRTILNDFVQEEINDYSFTPPDRRFDDSPFFLPDFNEKDDVVKNILFMIDTSGSMSDDMITAAFSEIKGAIDQFSGKLEGLLGFFDAAIIEPKPFSSFEEFWLIKAAGGGGTDFQIIFEYVAQHMEDEPPASIIILTDGYAPFPKEELANGIPVLWLLNNEKVNPPWGRVARIKV